jgi:hypothetical protein
MKRQVDRTTKLTRNNPRICRLFGHADHLCVPSLSGIRVTQNFTVSTSPGLRGRPSSRRRPPSLAAGIKSYRYRSLRVHPKVRRISRFSLFRAAAPSPAL